MRHPLIAGLVLCIAGCTYTTARDGDTSPHPATPAAPASRVPAPTAPRPAAPPVAAFAPVASPGTAADVLRDSANVQAEATRYVLWDGSHAENIRKLTSLAARVNRAVRFMDLSRKGSRYDLAAVANARRAVDDLAIFLNTKGD